MTNRSPNLREKYLDGEKLFRKYFEMGESRSISLLAEWAIMQGMKSSTGQEPTPMGIWKAMWRWASLKENRHKAWQIMNELDRPVDFSVWANDMINHKIPISWQHPTQAKLHRFLKENGWL
jgi:hypothetical protein